MRNIFSLKVRKHTQDDYYARMPNISHSSVLPAGRAKHLGRSRAPLKLLPVVAAVSVTLSACGGVYLEQKEPTLPDVDSTQLTLQQVVRNDVAVSESLEGIQGDCKDCESMSEILGEHSTQRAEILGGLWDPWGDDVPADAPMPPSVPEASKTWDELAQTMVKTALVDFGTAAQLQDETDRLAASSVAVGRMGDGIRLARAAGIESSEVDSWMAPVDQLSVTDTQLTADMEQDLAASVQQWDCAAQLIPLYTASQDEDTTAAKELTGRAQVEDLLTASTQVLSAGVPDQRSQSCVGSFESSPAGQGDDPLTQVENQLIATNLTLYAKYPDLYLSQVKVSESRSLPMQMILNQVLTWSSLSALPATPGIRVVEGEEQHSVETVEMIGDFPALPSPLDKKD